MENEKDRLKLIKNFILIFYRNKFKNVEKFKMGEISLWRERIYFDRLFCVKYYNGNIIYNCFNFFNSL